MLSNLLLPRVPLLQVTALHLTPGRGSGVLLGSPPWPHLGIPQGDSGSPDPSATPQSDDASTLGWDLVGVEKHRSSRNYLELYFGCLSSLSLGLRLIPSAYHHTTLGKLPAFLSSPALQKPPGYVF